MTSGSLRPLIATTGMAELIVVSSVRIPTAESQFDPTSRKQRLGRSVLTASAKARRAGYTFRSTNEEPGVTSARIPVRPWKRLRSGQMMRCFHLPETLAGKESPIRRPAADQQRHPAVSIIGRATKNIERLGSFSLLNFERLANRS